MRKICIALMLVIRPFCHGGENSLDLLISAEEIEVRICEIAKQINEDYRDKQLTIVMIMKGALCVTTDLIRHIDIPFKLEYIRASSYGYNGMSGGHLTIGNLDHLEIEGRDILLVDDIFETGNTLLGVMNKIQDKCPNSLKTLLLLVKDIPRQVNYRPNYVLFDIQNRFIIGYGMDYKELYRGLPAIYAFPNDIPPF